MVLVLFFGGAGVGARLDCCGVGVVLLVLVLVWMFFFMRCYVVAFSFTHMYSSTYVVFLFFLVEMLSLVCCFGCCVVLSVVDVVFDDVSLHALL